MNFRIISLALIFFLIFSSVDIAIAETPNEKIVVIINYDLLYDKSLLPLVMSKHDIKNIYQGVKGNEQGVKLLPADMKDKIIFDEFLSQFVEMSPSVYKSHWVKRLFALGALVPRIMNGPVEMIKYVSENKGAIGYVWESDLKGNEKGVRAVKISP